MDCDDEQVFTAPTGSYRRNAFGLSDMIGNAWEWVEDCWHDSYGRTTASAPGVCCGAARGQLPEVPPLRQPRQEQPGCTDDFVGFRLARTL
jgi:formylglycine-generating enzyme required for sulfatase activity